VNTKNIQECARISIVYAEKLLYISMFLVLCEAILHYFTRPGLLALKLLHPKYLSFHKKHKYVLTSAQYW